MWVRIVPLKNVSGLTGLIDTPLNISVYVSCFVSSLKVKTPVVLLRRHTVVGTVEVG